MCLAHSALVMEGEVDVQKIESRYIGDGVEASFDGYHIWLKTVDGNNNQVALEPAVLQKLFDYVKYVQRQVKTQRDLDGRAEQPVNHAQPDWFEYIEETAKRKG